MDTVSRFFNRFTAPTTTTWLRKIFLGLGIVIAIIATFIYFLGKQEIEKSLVEQIFHREQVIARAGAKSSEAHILNTENGLKLLARSQRITVMEKEVQGMLEQYVSDRKGTPTTGVAIVNPEGKIIANANNLGMPREIGVSVADRAYFKWAKAAREGEVYLDIPTVSRVGASKGQTIIPVASPIIENGKFKGVAVAVVLLSKLTELYLNPLKISQQTRIYLVDSNGFLLYASYNQLTGVNYFDYLKNKPFPGSEEVGTRLKKHVAEKTEGKLDLYLPNEQKGGTRTRFLIAHSPVVLGSTTLLLAVASPVEEALIFAGPLYADLADGVVFRLVAILVVAMWFTVSIRLVQRQAFLEGFVKGRDHKRIKNKN